jgi:hypothetical protein
MSGAAGSDVARRARGFVAAHGDAQQRVRAELLFDAAPRAALDAAFAPIDTDAAALRALEQLDAAGVHEGPVAERAAARLAAAQEADGGWSCVPALEQGAAAALVAGLLAKTRFARTAVLRAAGRRVAASWAPERVEGGAAAALAAYACFFANTDHEIADGALQWCGRELERGFRNGSIDALAAGRVFALCDAQALPGARLSADEVALSLAAAQADDGGFAPAAGDVAARVEATLAALAALRRLTPRAFRAASLR